MKDKTLEKAKKALKDWSDKVTVDEFIESHRKLGLVKPISKPFEIKFLYNIVSMVWVMPLLMLTALYLVDQQGFSEYRIIATLFTILCLWYVEKVVYFLKYLFSKK